jgi:hypothetical protein
MCVPNGLFGFAATVCWLIMSPVNGKREVIETKGDREVRSKIISDFFPSEGLLVYRGESSADSPRDPCGIVPLRSAAGCRAPL